MNMRNLAIAFAAALAAPAIAQAGTAVDPIAASFQRDLNRQPVSGAPPVLARSEVDPLEAAFRVALEPADATVFLAGFEIETGEPAPDAVATSLEHGPGR